MLASLLIVFREVLEAGLIVGIVLAATASVPQSGRWISGGVAAGGAGAALLAGFTGAISEALAGYGQEVFNAVILIVAVVMLAWHQLWMAGHAREIAREMQQLGQAVTVGRKSLMAMAVVVGLAVLREGAEVVLFLNGIAASTDEGPLPLLVGGFLGVGLGVAVAWLLYRGLLTIPMHRLFKVTGWLISLLAAGMAGQAAAILAAAGLIPSLGDEIWDTSWLLPEGSLVGKALHALIGYSDRPPGVQLVVYAVVLVALILGARFVQGPPRAAAPKPAR